jgi:hypothetical protein
MPVVRAIAVLSAVGIITAVVTFSALQSSGNALTGNSIETATPKLQLSTDGVSFGDSVPGFDFKGIIPGGSPQPSANGGYLLMVRNVGDSDLRLSVGVPTSPNVSGVTDLSKVNLIITPPAGNGTYPPQIIKLSSLLAGQVSIANQGVLIKTGTVSYRLQVSMDGDAVSGSSASISGLDIVVSGTPQ